MVRVQRMTSEFDPSFSACCQALNAEVAGLGTTLEHLPRTELIVAIKQHTIVGLAQLQGNFLAKLLVLPRYRRQGVATALITACSAFCRQAGYVELCLDTSPSLKAALALYHKLGFIPAPAHQRSDPSALHLRLDLSPKSSK